MVSKKRARTSSGGRATYEVCGRIPRYPCSAGAGITAQGARRATFKDTNPSRVRCACHLHLPPPPPPPLPPPKTAMSKATRWSSRIDLHIFGHIRSGVCHHQSRCGLSLLPIMAPFCPGCTIRDYHVEAGLRIGALPQGCLMTTKSRNMLQ